MNSLARKILGGAAAGAMGLGLLVGGAAPASAVAPLAADTAGHHHADGHDHGDDVGVLANHSPASGVNQLCGYTAFERLGVDGVYHRYTYYASYPVPGGGREATWRAHHPNSTGGWNYVGLVGRIC